ncbi:hypothetical protein BX070DRAFT_221764 [Coemansia spiralis]|nr:hypothetical protein BX070DRAFT_221764 [Coemansia spiralis]
MFFTRLLSLRRSGLSLALTVLLVCGVALVAATVSSRSSAASLMCTPDSNGSTDSLSRDIVCRAQHEASPIRNFIHGFASVIGTVLVYIAVVAGFLIFGVLVPLFSFIINAMLYTTASIKAAIAVGLVGATAGLYYFRYSYAAPKKSAASSPKKGSKGPDRQDSGFDLHPDVAHVEEPDGSSYMSSLESRGTYGRGGNRAVEAAAAAVAAGSTGTGFPADFLSMFMKSISIFGYIEEPVFHEFSRQLQTRRLLAGERMFDNEGDRDDQNFYVVIDGQVQIFLADTASVVPPMHPTPATVGSVDVPGAPLADGWSEIYDEDGHGGYSSDVGSNPGSLDGENEPLVGFAAMEPQFMPFPQPSSSSSSAAGAAPSAILLNVVGPGDVLSSLFSILGLFTEGVPLRLSDRQQNTPPSTSIATATSVFSPPDSVVQEQQQQQQQYMADFPLDEAQHMTVQSGNQVKAAQGMRAAQQTFITLDHPTSSADRQRKNSIYLDDNQPATATQQSLSGSGAFVHMPQVGATDAPPLRPNIIARATTDTTLAMIPASAFQRVTRLYPKAAAHILQVILTRLQRVTFATLYDYLDLPDELVSIERAISNLAKYPLSNDITQSDVLQSIKKIYTQFHTSDMHTAQPSQSPMLSPQAFILSSRASPTSGLAAANYAMHLGSLNTLQSSWKITHQNLQTMSKNAQPIYRPGQSSVTPEKPNDTDTREAGQSTMLGSASSITHLASTSSRHRRSGSDSIQGFAIPATDDINSLRTAALHQLCHSLGLNPNSVDGRYMHIQSERHHRRQHGSTAGSGAPTASSSASASRRSSTHRKLPRTEHLLPLLQSINVPDRRQSSGGTPPMSLAEIPSLVDELELYHIPSDFVLVEQGQRPQGLYIILDGKVEITHRDSVKDFTGIEKDGTAASLRSKKGENGGAGADVSISEATRLMSRLAEKSNLHIERRKTVHGPLKQPSSLEHPKKGERSSGKKSHSRKNSWSDSDESKDNKIEFGDSSSYLANKDGHNSESSTGHIHRPYYSRSGDVVGYLPALTDMASLYTARSKGSTVVGFISRWALDRISERYPIILMTLARRLTSQLPPLILNIDYALEWVQAKANQMIYRQGEMSNAVYVVLSGRLRAFIEKEKSGVSILAEFGQGQSVGEPNLLLNQPCRFNLHAIRDAELVRIPTALFKALMQTAPNLTFHLSRTLAMRTAQSLQQQQQQQLLVDQQSRAGLDYSLKSGIRSHNKNLKSIAIIPVNSDVPVHAFAEQLEEALTSVAGNVALLDHTAVSRVLGRHAFSRIARLKIASWIAEMEQRCRLLLHVADGGISSQWTRHCVRHSDFILLVGLGDGDPSVGDFERLLLALKTTARKELVLLHENRSCTTGSTREWLKRRPWVHAHHHIQMPLGYEEIHLSPESGSYGQVGGAFERARRFFAQSIWRSSRRMLPVLAQDRIGRIKTSLEKYYRRLIRDKQLTPTTYQGHRSDFARLARYLCGKSVGVVLSGGGARGIALLGVMQAFEEAGIPVDMVGGTSIGAFMSGLYSRNPDSVAIHGLLKAFSRRMSSTWRLLLDVTYPILAYTSGREFNRAIWKVFKDAEIEDMWLPFYCMTANITKSRSEVHTTGLLWRVVRASMSLSGFVPPLCDENGDMLVDGGYLDNLPVRVMKDELGADMIFAVDIAGEYDTSAVKYGASVSGFWVLLNHLNPFRSYWIPTLSEVQSRLTYASSDRELENAKIADSCVYLRVPPKDVGVLDFGRFDELHKRGYEYAKEWTRRWQQRGLLGQWQTAASAPGVTAAAPSSSAAAAAAAAITTKRTQQISANKSADRLQAVPTAYKLTRRNSF